MARRKNLTDKMVKDLKPETKRRTIPDPELRGHYVRVTPSGAKSYCAVARNPLKKKQVWATIGDTGHYKIDKARDEAREAIKRIKKGLPAFAPPEDQPDTFKAVADNYIERHVKAKGLRSQAEMLRILDVYIYPHWKDREFISIKRSDVTALLDGIEDANGARQADCTLSIVSGIMNWFAKRSDDYVPPLARGMRRSDPKTRKRKRILEDDELPVIWKVAETGGTLGAIIRIALLTAQRKGKVVTMKWADVKDGVWSISSEDREKGHGGDLVLSEKALAIINAQPRDSDYVFAGRGDKPFCGFSPCKRSFNKKVTMALREAAVERGEDPEAVEEMPNWTIHDLRRTARSLLSRAKVRGDISERVMGHAIGGVEEIYDRHKYRDEKADALKKLAGQIEMILNPPDDNVVPIREGVE
jgi:integrase